MEYAATQGQAIHGGYGNGGTARTAIQGPSILSVLDEHDKTIQILHGTINTLTDRLRPILGPDGPSDTASAKNTPPLVSVLERIGQASGGVQMAEARLTDLLRRIQL